MSPEDLRIFIILLLCSPLIIGGLISNFRWKHLVSRYATQLRPTTDRAPITVVVIRPSPFAQGWCRIELLSDGVLFYPTLQFRLLFKPLFVPWAELSGRASRAMFKPAVSLTTQQAPRAELRVIGPQGEALRSALAERGSFRLDGGELPG